MKRFKDNDNEEPGMGVTFHASKRLHVRAYREESHGGYFVVRVESENCHVTMFLDQAQMEKVAATILAQLQDYTYSLDEKGEETNINGQQTEATPIK